LVDSVFDDGQSIKKYLHMSPVYLCVVAADKEAMPMLVDIMNDIQEEYVNSKPEDGRLWFEGQIAVSQFTDDNLFYRARVLNVIDADTVEV